jgi:Ca2+-binding EF-hand superfamily protein
LYPFKTDLYHPAGLDDGILLSVLLFFMLIPELPFRLPCSRLGILDSNWDCQRDGVGHLGLRTSHWEVNKVISAEHFRDLKEQTWFRTYFMKWYLLLTHDLPLCLSLIRRLNPKRPDMTQGKTPPVFTPSDLAKLRNAFDSFDTNRDGRISVQVLGELIHAVGYSPRPDEVADMIEEVSSPVLQFRTFAYLIARHRRAANPKQELIDAFRLFDKDGSGRVTIKDIRRVLANLKDPFTEDEIGELIGHPQNYVDDKTDSVNYEDFVKLILEFY